MKRIYIYIRKKKKLKAMAVTESERKRIPDLGTREAKMHDHHAFFLLFFEGGDTKSYIIRVFDKIDTT